MKTMRLVQSVPVLAVIAIATTGMSYSAIAQTDITPSQASVKLAQASLTGQCRATKLQMPVFSEANTTSEALQLLSPNAEVTLADNRVSNRGFIRINAPVEGYVQAVNLKPCSASTGVSTTDTTETPSTSSTTDLCRRVARPPQGLVIRREPTTASARLGRVAYLGRVTLSANPASEKRDEVRKWVEISSPARGWVSNGLLTEEESNLGFCQ
ncbi:MAG: SH3 domain-containing protein [Cyanobacteriota bacterium]